MKLHDQDRRKTYDYHGQELYSMPVLSPRGDMWGINLHMMGVEELIGTFDTALEIQDEMAAIRCAEGKEYYVSGHRCEDCTEDFNALLEEVQNNEMAD